MRRSLRYLLVVLAAILFLSFITDFTPSNTFSSKKSLHNKPSKNKLEKYFSSVSKYGLKSNERLLSDSHAQEQDPDIDHDGVLEVDEIMKALEFDKAKYNGSSGDIVEENMDFYEEVYRKRINEPRNAKLTYNYIFDENGVKRTLTQEEYQRENATLLTLVRNSELKDIVYTIRQIEATWNYNFHYPYTFISDEEFTDEFISTVKRHASGEVFFEIIPPEIWNKPSNINPEREQAGIQKLLDNKVQYADMESYHNMCRFNSAYFYRLEGLKKFKWYWRFEPKTDYFCNVDYDIFKFMEDNDKTYGFTIALYDNPLTVETLWPITLDFIGKNPQYVHPNAAFKFLTDNVQNPKNAELANGYSTCHFWSNFEIANMDFYRAEPYSKWMERLEQEGGFYYERWGDAPVHSIGVALFEDKSKIHWFRDIGYFHSPYFNCPTSSKCSRCSSSYFAPEDVHDQNCLSNWIKYEMTVEELQQY